MKKLVCIFSIACLAFACNTSGEKDDTKNSGEPRQTQQNLEVFADSLVRLDKSAMETIETAARYYQQLVPSDTTMADSAAVLLLNHVWKVIDTTNQKLYRDTTNYFDLIYNKSTNVPEKQKRFQQLLARNHINLQGDGEGGAIAVLDYTWINPILQQKTSANVDRYLTLLAREEKEPTLLDAGLAIETKELVDRLILTEMIRTGALPKPFAEDLERKQKFYTGVLLLGSDNSPSLDYNDLRPAENFHEGYTYLLTTYPDSKAAQLITQWQATIQSRDEKKIAEWRSKYSYY